MKPRLGYVVLCALMFIAGAVVLSRGDGRGPAGPSSPFDAVINQNANQMLGQGRQIFRFDTFGDEAFWGDTLMLHQAIEGTKNGGTGNRVLHLLKKLHLF